MQARQVNLGLGQASRRPIVTSVTPNRSAPRYHSRMQPVCNSTVPGQDEEKAQLSELEARILAGEFTDSGSTKEQLTRPIRKVLASDPTGAGRFLSLQLAKLGRLWVQQAVKKIPVATGDIREIVGQPVFIPLYKLYQAYGKIFRLSFGPKNFVIISDAKFAKQILLTNADKYSKGILSEILEFVMGTGLIPADGDIWKMRRRAIVPALHRKYVASMVGMFGDCTLNGCRTLDRIHAEGKSIDMENYFSRLALDIIGKAVFNYDFDSLTHDDPVIKAVYVLLREAEYRSTFPIAYWNIPGVSLIVPRQRACVESLKIVNDTLDALIAKCKKLVEEEDEEFVEEFLSEADPSILHFLIASGDQISSKQLRDDLMTMLVAGHETTAAVLTWTFHLLEQHPDVAQRVRDEVDRVIGDRTVTVEDMRELKFTTRVINEAMRLFPQPPVLIRRALEDDQFDEYTVEKGADIFISVWNLHRSKEYWEQPDTFNPDRFPLDGPMPNEVTENFAYLPFGGGRRKCIGDQFAMFESIVGLSMLMRRYEFKMAPDAPPVGMTTGATIHTVQGLYMVPVPRTNRPPTPPRPDYEAMAAAAGSSAGGCPVDHKAMAAAAAASTSGHGAASGGCPVDHSAMMGASSSSSSSNGSSSNGVHRVGATMGAGEVSIQLGGGGVSISGGGSPSISGTSSTASRTSAGSKQ